MDVDGFGQASKNSGQKPETMNQRMVIKWNIVQFVTLCFYQMHTLYNFLSRIQLCTRAHITHHKLTMSSPPTPLRSHSLA